MPRSQGWSAAPKNQVMAVKTLPINAAPIPPPKQQAAVISQRHAPELVLSLFTQ
ncbi:MAG: hypothetical protein QOJ58_4870 [Alphaproteobacteria bacterium]|nr:hypothetical protein [Alphaproteobacteria bacterium]